MFLFQGKSDESGEWSNEDIQPQTDIEDFLLKSRDRGFQLGTVVSDKGDTLGVMLRNGRISIN